MRFRPCIDLHEGRVKQIVGSSLSAEGCDGPVTNFETGQSPGMYAAMYREDCLPGGHVIMLGPGNEDAAQEALAAFPGGFQVGGGIVPKNAVRFLDMGASHVIVTSYVFAQGDVHWDNLKVLCEIVGRDRLVVDLSCRKRDGLYFVATERWRNMTDVSLDERNMTKLSEYCCEFLVHAVEVEGKRGGIDEDLVRLLAGGSPVPVTYAGGIRSLDDLDLVDRYGQARVDATVGSALDIFGGDLPYRDVVAWHCRHNASTDAKY